MQPNNIMIKDGGFATQLSVHVGEKIDGPLWSAKFNASDPNAVVQTHLDFLREGAEIILTNTYQASIEGYVQYLGLDKEQSVNLIKTTVQLAHIARQTFVSEQQTSKTPMIAGSIGPYGAHLHDGSEYSGNYVDNVALQDIYEWHKVRIDAVLDAGVDILAIETIPCQIEAEIILDLIHDSYPDIKFWISFQCRDEYSLAHGEMFKTAVGAIWKKVKKQNMKSNCLALGVNCVNPKFVASLFKSLNADISSKEKIPLVVYPNSGEIYDVKTGWGGRKDCVPLESYVSEWLALGVHIIGGCCRTYAKDIGRIKHYIKNVQIK